MPIRRAPFAILLVAILGLGTIAASPPITKEDKCVDLNGRELCFPDALEVERPTSDGGLVGVLHELPDVMPLSADEWHKRVYINVEGAGVGVDSWYTKARQFPGDGYMCPTAIWYYEISGIQQFYHAKSGTCFADPPANAYRTIYGPSPAAKMPTTFAQGTLLCNRWDSNQSTNRLPGTPCIGIGG